MIKGGRHLLGLKVIVAITVFMASIIIRVEVTYIFKRLTKQKENNCH